MIHYILKYSDGTVFQRGVCQSEDELPVVEGLVAEIIESDDPRQPQGQPDPTYANYRQMAYPAIGDQFDMLWHAMDDGLIPKIEPLYSEIKAVKDKYPKPE